MRGWPKPLRDIAYQGALGDVVRVLAPHTEADPAALLFNIYAIFGSVIGRTAHFRAEADRHHTNLFVGLVGETAKGRKGVSKQVSKQVFFDIDTEWVQNHVVSGMSSGEGLIWAVRDAIEKHQPIKDRGRILGYESVVEDPGITDKRLLVEEPEFASTLKVMARQGSTLSPVIRQAWDGHDLRIVTKNTPARATAPHISLLVHITRDELRRYLEATETANGFGNRFLWVCVRRSKQLPDGGRHVNLEPHTCEASTHSVDGLHQEGQIPQPVRLSPLKLEKRLLAIHNEGALRLLLGYRPAVPGRDNPARVELRLAQGVPHALFDVLPMRSTPLGPSHPKSQLAVAERPPCQ